MFGKFLNRMRSPSEVSNLEDEAKEDAVVKEQVERREAERAVLAPAMKKKAKAEAKKAKLMAELAKAEQDDDEVLVFPCVFLCCCVSLFSLFFLLR